MLRSLQCVLLFVIMGTASLSAQDKPTLTVKKIMQDPKTWIGTSPSNPFWSEDGKTLYFYWNPEANPGDSLYKTTAAGTPPVKVSKQEEKDIAAHYRQQLKMLEDGAEDFVSWQ